MGVRKNAKHLNTTERENLVQAFVMMKADPVPGRPYNWYDAFVLLHRYIQNVSAPAVPGGSPANGSVNFGHLDAAFCPWHRYFLLRFEQQLQTYVAGVMLPYWDWTDPAGDIMVADFMGPNGVMANNWEVRQGYFAATAPGSGGNATPLPGWWPGGLSGWTLPAAWGTFAGALRRRIDPIANLPTATAIRQTLDSPGYATFRGNLESGVGVPGTMHNQIHAWFGAAGTNAHMQEAASAAFDPMFYLHHANVDRLWAMWQMDGHGNDYPPDGAVAAHHRLNDPMYPWVGATGGYSANGTLPGFPDLPDFSGEPAVTAADVMDHRALGYSYDCMITVGIALDRTGSMLAQTPDPMTGMGDVSKWDAATQGVSAFLQDCEAAYQSSEAYVLAGVKTFRSLGGNDFDPVFAGTPYGVIRNGGAYSATTFDGAIAALAPGGATPLADALSDTFDTLVQPPFAGLPADEPRYLALFTDGMLTSGSPVASIPDGSLDRTAVFAMGFGHPGEVDYPTLDALVAKGEIDFSTPQVFHGGNAGQIDKFFSKVLANALGYAPVMDPAIEMFAGEHVHLPFTATSAEAAFYITAQGMDFDDEAWSYQLMAPDGSLLYADGSLPAHDHGGHGDSGHGGCHCVPHVVARRGKGRLTLFVRRNNCDDAMWIGNWMLVVARRATDFDGMLMMGPGPMLFPVAAGPVRGPHYARLLTKPGARMPTRLIAAPASNALDQVLNSTNRLRDPCTVVVNVYARTGLRLDLDVRGGFAGDKLKLELLSDVAGTATVLQTAVRAVAPRIDLRALLPEPPPAGRSDPRNNSARLLARLERKDPESFRPKDEAGALVSRHGGDWHYHLENTGIAGAYHFGVLVRGIYRPASAKAGDHHDAPGHDDHGPSGHEHHGNSTADHAGRASAGCCTNAQYFERILTVSKGLAPKPSA